MWRNYLIVGLRSLAKNRVYSIINIAGLAIGMAACLMILLFVRYELSYDRWLPNAENTYQLQTHFRSEETGEETDLQMASYITAATLKKDFPQVDRTVYALSAVPVVFRNGEATPTENFLFVDNLFFDVVQLPFVEGDPRTALKETGSIVLTQSEAQKRFGSTNVLGKTLTLISRGKYTDYRVTGVLRDLPRNSHMKLTMVARIDFPAYFADQPDFLTCWGCQSGWVYVSLKPGSDPAAIQAALPAWEKRNIPDQNVDGIRYNPGDEQDWRLTNIRDVHLGIAQEGVMTPGNDRRTIVTFAIIALLILGMACVNFTNLATARASQRAREVALRKVLGANRRQLIVQFIGESILVAGIAMMIALALVELLLKPFAAFLKADLQLSYFGQGGIALPIVVLVLLVGLAGGLYPALFLSRFQPATVLKANRSSAETPGSGRLRNILVVGQFAVSIGLIVCTAVIYAQTVYARTTDPGYQRDHILQVEDLNRYQMFNLGDTLVRQTRALEGVKAAGRTGIGIDTDNENNTGFQVPGIEKPVTTGIYPIDAGFFKTMGIKLLAGRNFDENRPMDDSTTSFPEVPAAEQALVDRGVNLIVNRLAAQRMGFKDPAQAIGKQVKAGLVDWEEYGLVPATIIGVVENSRFRSIRTPLEPITFRLAHTGHDVMVVRYSGNPAAVRARVEKVWKGLASDVPFVAKYSEDIVQDLYEAEDARATIFAAFAVLAVIVACLGLFGLAAFTAERRTKEIGIRKVLGARSRDIVRLLAWQFSKPVIVANLIAWPVAWWVMRDWLNSFDARIALGPTPFLLAGLLALAIAIGTIAGHAFKVARANPIHALRYE
ncbi:ABC transporter permease [Allosphingosinicella humi]